MPKLRLARCTSRGQFVRTMNVNAYVTYEDFGAVGDGVADDLPAICAAHAHANAEDLPVKTRSDAIYHLGKQALTAVIQTDTDWNTSRFTIDDRGADDHSRSLFSVESKLVALDLRIETLSRDQPRLDLHPEVDCFVYVENENQRKYIRKGLNQNGGDPQQDGFVLRRDGRIDCPIDWEYDEITLVEARPLDERPLRLQGGIFTTFANCMHQDVGYTYWARNIYITRSNTEVDGLTHYVVGETDRGSPYKGFVNVSRCANFTLKNSFFTGHKTYKTIGSASKPVPLGSYDIVANSVINLLIQNCAVNHILDRSHWGVICTNFCKNIVLEDCSFSRMDTHMGVSGGYILRRCTLGHMGLNAIGRGKLLLENSKTYGVWLVNFREDYGSTWSGDVEIHNCEWIPGCGDEISPVMFNTVNDGMHDFGYPCSMPERITIDGLTVDDRNHPASYEGLVYFQDPDVKSEGELPEPRPFPYEKSKSIQVKGLVVLSGKPVRVSANTELEKYVTVTR